MKFAILSFHRAYNYGAVLQNYALNKVLNGMNVSCCTLDYRPPYFTNEYYMKPEFKLWHPPVKTWVRRFLVRKVLAARIQTFEDFISKYIPLSGESYDSYEEICRIRDKYDCYLTGSDQVWSYSCSRFDPTFFLDFPDALAHKRFSYAASFGTREIPGEFRDEYRRRLSGYSAYSVREADGRLLLKELCQVDAAVCCDPTLLFDRQEWERFPAPRNAEAEEYILLYYVEQSEQLLHFARRLGDQLRKKVICIACNSDYKALAGRTEKRLGFDVRNSASPAEFLHLIRNASYVLTNSFHGTVFSILFNKNFGAQIVLDDGRRNERANEILNYAGLQNCKIESEAFSLEKTPDWDSVNRKIQALREQSLKYLEEITAMAAEE